MNLRPRFWLGLPVISMVLLLALAGCGGGGKDAVDAVDAVDALDALDVVDVVDVVEVVDVTPLPDVVDVADAVEVLDVPDAVEVVLVDPRTDSDDDGLSDIEERTVTFTNPLKADTDEDGLPDKLEVTLGTDPNHADTDRDGLSDRQEVEESGSDPLLVDSDDDGLDDLFEFYRGTNPRSADTDNDGVDDTREVFETRTDPLAVDSDGDQLSDADELERGTRPYDADTDQDALSDGAELAHGTNPLVADTDADGLSDGAEVARGTNPLLADSDADGADDRAEFAAGTDPLNPDSDGDGLSDGDEAKAGSDPLAADSDNDGLSDLAEVTTYGTSPTSADTDADGLNDRLEILNGLDPLDDADGKPAGGVATADLDLDGLTNYAELIEVRTDPRRPDTDLDGLSDGAELALEAQQPNDVTDADGDGVANVLDPDSDGDGLVDGVEVSVGANPYALDSDADGVPDADEPSPLTDSDADGLVNVADPDSDGDGLLDGVERGLVIAAGLSLGGDLDGDGLANGITDPDSDGDGMNDRVEVETPTVTVPGCGTGLASTLSPFVAADGDEDWDCDGATNRHERLTCTPDGARCLDIGDPDTDDDGLGDGVELRAGLAPLDASDASADFDNDGLTNAEELAFGTALREADTDHDGLRDGAERALGSSGTDPDTDDDGLLDGAEAQPGADSDGDGTINVLDPDSDNDGLVDGDEILPRTDSDFDGWVNMLDPDSDGDGIPDGQDGAQGADSDHDGQPDSLDTDSDNDGLPDGVELAGTRCQKVRCPFRAPQATCQKDTLLPPVPTNPASSDTDGDGLPDAIECAMGLDPALKDWDADGALDGAEVVLAGGRYVTVTDPFDPDTDDDGVPDGPDSLLTSPLVPDSDGDGIPDGQELVSDYNGKVLDLSPPQDGVDLEIPVPHAVISWVSVGVFVGPPGPLPPHDCTAGQAPVVTLAPPNAPPPTVTLTIVDGSAPPISAVYSTRWEGERLIATRPFQPSGNTVRVIVTSDQPIQVSRVFLAGLPKPTWGPPAVGMPTFADRCDSDGDGLSDATERRSGTIWLEAEHYAPVVPHTPLLPADDPQAVDPRASGGRVLPMRAGETGFLLGDAQWGYVPGQIYSVFVRGAWLPAAYSPCYPDIRVTVHTSFGYARFGEQGGFALSDQLEWRYAGSFIGEDVFTLSIAENACAEATWVLDRVALVPRRFNESYATVDYVELARGLAGANGTGEDTNGDGIMDVFPPLPEWHRVPGATDDAKLLIAEEAPFGLSDPLEADTDGDGFRPYDGVIAGSTGWLTDQRERRLRMNPFSLDSDGDSTLTDPEPDGYWFRTRTHRDEYTDLQAVPTAFGPAPASEPVAWEMVPSTPNGADGRPDLTDDTDPSPRSLDFDHDGIVDDVEVSAQVDAVCAPGGALDLVGGCTGDAYLDLNGPDSDFSDPPPFCVLDLANVMTAEQQLCWHADDDRDDDGLADPDEDSNRNGQLDPGELDPNDPDTDDDCIPDGVEAGVVDPDTHDTLRPAGTPWCGEQYYCALPGRFAFVADADRAGYITDPNDIDSDDDGIPDGDGLDHFCGDGVVDAGEVCDDGNQVTGDGCSFTCASDETCGNGVVDGALGEACDDGGTRAGDDCGPTCGMPSCGNGTRESGEVCDDGNLDDGDGCSATCLSDETCGNGVLDLVAHEECDDDNTLAGDGCTPTCTLDAASGPMLLLAGEDLDCNGAWNPTPGAAFDPDVPTETNAALADTDADFLADRRERTNWFAGLAKAPAENRTDPNDPDSDHDGLLDGEETGTTRTDPNDPDTDAEGLSDAEEVRPPTGVPATDPNDPDTDADGLPDFVEIRATAPLVSGQPTDPTSQDTDGDGLCDAVEVHAPVVTCAVPVLPKDGGLWTAAKVPASDPNNPDSDGDGLLDGDEVMGTGVVLAGVCDNLPYGDVPFWTPPAPWAPVVCTDPTTTDTDQDGFPDDREWALGSHPNDPNSIPVTVNVGGGDVDVELPPDDGTWNPTLPAPPGLPPVLVSGPTTPDGPPPEVVLSCGSGTPASLVLVGSVTLRYVRVSAEPGAPLQARLELPTDVSVHAHGPCLTAECPTAERTRTLLWVGRGTFDDSGTRLFAEGVTSSPPIQVPGDGATVRLGPPECNSAGDCPAMRCVNGTCSFGGLPALGDDGSAADLPAACVSDAECNTPAPGCAADRCAPAVGAGALGPDVVLICGGDVLDTSAEVDLPMGTDAACPLTVRPALTTLNLQSGRLTVRDALEVRDSGGACNPLPIDPTVCWAPKKPLRLWVGMPGSLNVDFSSCATGGAPGSCLPKIDGKLGTLVLGSLPWIDLPSGAIPPIPPLALPDAPDLGFGMPNRDITLTPLSPTVESCEGLRQAGAEPAVSDVYPTGQFGYAGQASNVCCTWDLKNHRYHCSGSTEFKNCKKVNGRRVCQKDKNKNPVKYTLTASVDYDLRGLYDFVTDKKHSFTELGCSPAMKAKIAAGKLDPSVCSFHCVDNLNEDPADPVFSPDGTLCENGQLKMVGELVFPIPQVPAIDTIINGLMLVDHRPPSQDGDKLFIGAYGTLSFGKTSIEETAALVQQGLGLSFPLRLQMAKVTAAILFDKDNEPSRVVLAGTSGLQIADYVDTTLIPDVVRNFFQGEQREMKGCLYLEDDPAVGAKAGRLEGLGRFQVAMFPVDLKFTLDPPVNNEGKVDPHFGGFSGQGIITMPTPFAGQALVVSGKMGFDGKFVFAGALDVALALPGYPAFSLQGPTAQIRLSNEGVRVSGELPLGAQSTGPTACLTSLGTLSASGLLERSGAFDFALSGDLSPLCMPLSSVSGRFSSSAGISIDGSMGLKFGSSTPINAMVRGTITAPNAWRFETTSALSFPFGGTKLANAKAVITPAGVNLSGSLQIPGLTSVNVSGTAQANGDFKLTGAMDVSAGPIRLGAGTVTFQKAGGVVSIKAVANVSLAELNIGSVSFDIGTDGAFAVAGNASLVGQTFYVTINRAAAGSVSASGSVGVSVGPASGAITVGFASVAYADFSGTVSAFGGSSTVSVRLDSSGCFSIGGFPYPCPTWTNPFKFCTANVGVCF